MSTGARIPLLQALRVGEEWRPVVGAEDYEVSSDGRVRWSVGTPKMRKRSPGGFPKTWTDDQGYSRVTVRIDGVQKIKLVHVLVARAFLGECPCGLEVNHINGVKSDASASNLEYVTHKENVHHAHRTGLAVILRGVEHGSSVLNPAKVRVIRRCRQVGMTLRAIGGAFGIDRSTVSQVVRRDTWRHVEHAVGWKYKKPEERR